MPPAENSSTGKRDRAAAPGADPAFEAGLKAYERGDWLSARRLLGDAVETEPRKQNRLRAAEVLAALAPDRFALGLAALLAVILLGVMLLAVG